MQGFRWIAVLALFAAACTPSVEYGAAQSQRYAGRPVFTMYEEWGTPVHQTRFFSGGRFYQFRKPDTDCMVSAWVSDLGIVYRVAVSGPETCATRP